MSGSTARRPISANQSTLKRVCATNRGGSKSALKYPGLFVKTQVDNRADTFQGRSARILAQTKTSVTSARAS